MASIKWRRLVGISEPLRFRPPDNEHAHRARVAEGPVLAILAHEGGLPAAPSIGCRSCLAISMPTNIRMSTYVGVCADLYSSVRRCAFADALCGFRLKLLLPQEMDAGLAVICSGSCPKSPLTRLGRVFQLKVAIASKRIAVLEMAKDGQVDLGRCDLTETYITLADLEAVFRSLKSELGLRPVFHQQEDRTEGHLFITVLAYELVQATRRQMKA